MAGKAEAETQTEYGPSHAGRDPTSGRSLGARIMPPVRARHPMFGNVPPDDTVKLVFNLSQGDDIRGPWNEEPDFEYIEDPQPKGGMPPAPINPDDERPRKPKAGGRSSAAPRR
jgi:hypothetical protein